MEQNDKQPDAHQIKALKVLQRLRDELDHIDPASLATRTSGPKPTNSFFAHWFSQVASTTSRILNISPPKGVYLHGGVGCGKTFLMNLFYHSITDDHPWAKAKQKIHFHKFMLRVHQEMHVARKQGGIVDDILPAVVSKTLAQGRLLCLDEFQVTDVADALILQRLFTGLWENGCIVVATSNREPNELYKDGLQRDRFLPFIDLLKRQCQVVSMTDSEVDYRLIQKAVSGIGKVYFVGREELAQFDQMFYELAGDWAVAPTFLQTQGRKVKIPQAALQRGICRFNFEDLCQKALGAADYLVIGQHFHTVFVQNVPVMSLTEVNWMRRFITFVDSMYESRVKLVLHTQAPVPTLVTTNDDDKTKHDELFAFDRTVSRLEEMSSLKYLQKRWVAGAGAESAARLLSHAKVTPDIQPSLGDHHRSH